MKIQSVAFRSTLAVSFVFAAYYANSASFSSFLTRRAVPKATLSDVVLLFGSEEQVSSVNPVVATRLRDCFKFLVNPDGNDENELMRRPPAAVLELARIAADSSGNSRAIGDELREYLNPQGTKIPVPVVEGSDSSGCRPISGDTAQCSYCNNQVLDAYLSLLFRLIADRASSVGLNVTLNRFDLFHGHFFLANNTRRLGLLFHAKEFPICGGNFPCPQTVPYCERGSNVVYDESSMNLRNILWLAPVPNRSGDAILPGVLVVLDARPGGIIYRDLLTGPKYARTIEEVGSVSINVNYLNVGAAGAAPDYKVILA